MAHTLPADTLQLINEAGCEWILDLEGQWAIGWIIEREQWFNIKKNCRVVGKFKKGDLERTLVS